MKQLVQVAVPKTKAELMQALSATPVKRLRVDLVRGTKIENSTIRTVADWRRAKSRVMVVVLDLGAEQ